MHQSILIVPAVSGGLGLSRILKQVIPAELPVVSLELANATKGHGYFKSPSLKNLAELLLDSEELARLDEGAVVISSCWGCLIAMEFCAVLARIGKPARRLVLIDPPGHHPFCASNDLLAFHALSIYQYLRTSIKLSLAGRWLKGKDSGFEYRMLLPLRSAFYLRDVAPCAMSMLLSRDRRHVMDKTFLSRLVPERDTHLFDYRHGKIYEGAGLQEVGAVLRRLISEVPA